MVREWVRPGLGIDLGTANTVVFHPRRGIVLNEPSVMVVRDNDERGQPVVVGREARDMMGRTPNGMSVVRPLQDGVITDLQAARAFVVAMMRRVPVQVWEKVRPHAVIGVPVGATTLERQALLEAASEAGLGRVELVPEPIAGALGAGLDPMERRAQMVVDVGGGTSEVTAFCFGGVLASRSCRVAGDEMTQALLNHLRAEHQLLVGELTAEEAKKTLAGAGDQIFVEGRDAATGRPRRQQIQPEELAEAMRAITDVIVQALAATLSEDLPPQAVADILSAGVVAFGGGSLLAGFSERLQAELGFPVRPAERPLTCVAEGAAACLAHPLLLRGFAGGQAA
ncbi:MAG TPA: rod shape-determining protein [Candidatus Dormibacteraeota bacterium]